MKRISLLLILVTLLAWIAGCESEAEGEIVSYDLTIASTAGGAVTTPGEGVFTYDEGTVVNLIAGTGAGYRFINWTGDVGAVADTNDAETTITMSDNYSIMANFALEILEIWDWHDLNAIRYNLSASYLLMNDLDSTTVGYEELASTAANGGNGWEPIGASHNPFTGLLDGQSYEMRDLVINGPHEAEATGLFAFVDVGGVIANICMVNADVTGGNHTGCLVGLISYDGTVNDSYSSGNVLGENYVGGLVGSNWGGSVTNSYSTSSVNGEESVGGLAGDSAGTVSNSYASGNVTGSGWIGGLVGWNLGTVSNSYSTGGVTGIYDVGGLVGYNDGIVNNSFWDTETSGQASSAGGIGKTTIEMQDITTFLGATWDIVAVANPNIRNLAYIWNIVDGVTYPFLSWQSVS
jgi:hypothetical protein